MAEAGAPKPRASEFPKELINANGRDKWDPAKYERLAHYIFLYDYIKLNLQDFTPYPDETGVMRPSRFKDASGNYIDFGLSPNSLSVEINDTIRNHYDWFAEHLKFSTPLSAGGYDVGIDKAKFLAEMDEYVSHTAFIMQALKEKGKKGKDEGNLSSQDALSILRAKEDEVRDAYFNNIRKAVEGKPGNIDPETGKPKGGSLVVDVTKAMQERNDKLAQIAEESGSLTLKTLFSVGGVGVTIASLLTLLSGFGIPVGGIIGASGFLGGAFAKVLAGLLGTTAGAHIVIKNFPEIFKSLGGVVGKVADFFNFHFGIGKYAPGPDGVPKGYLARIKRYNKTMELKKLMISFQIPKEASQFDNAFDAFYDNFARNAQYLTPTELENARKDVRYNYMVTNANVSDPREGPSPFGRERALIAAHAPTERVDYNLENPNEIERIYGRLQTGNPSLEEVRVQLENFSAHKDAFVKAGAQERYNELMNGYTDIILKAVEKTAFDDALTSTTISTLRNSVSNPLVGERIKNGRLGNKEGKINNIIRFIEKEGSNSTINADLRVNIGRQFSFNAESLEKACRDDAFGDHKITDASPELASVEIIAKFIENYETSGVSVNIAGTFYDDAGIRTLLSSVGATNTTVYNYLDYMLSKKEDSVSLGKDVLNTSISNGAGNLDADNEDVIKASCKNDLNVELATDLLNFDKVGAIARSITNTISSASSEAVILAVENDIVSLPDKYGRTKDYLVYLLYKKAEKTKTKNDFINEISALTIADIKTSKPVKLKERIMNSKLSTIAKSNAVQALKDQVSRLEAEEQNEINEEVYNIIRNNGYSKFDEVMGQIEAITFETFDTADVRQKLFRETIQAAHPEQVRRYLELQFNKKIERVFMEKLDDEEDTLTNGTDSLQKNADYLRKISTYSLLTDAQKDRLVDEISKYLVGSFAISLKNMERQVLDYAGKSDKLTEKLRVLVEEPYAVGGFVSNFKNNPSPQFDEVLKRIKNLTDNSGILDWIVPDALYGSGQNSKVVDKDSNDTRFIVAAYFKDPKTGRSDTDGLRVELTNIHNIYVTSFASVTPTRTDEENPDSFIYKMRNEIVSVDKNISSEADKLAAFMSMKKHILEMYKYQLYQYFNQSIGTTSVTSGFNTWDDSGRRMIEVVSDNWVALMAEVDAKCTALLKSREVVTSTLQNFTNYQSGVMTIKSFNDPDKIIRFMKQNEHNQPNLY